VEYVFFNALRLATVNGGIIHELSIFASVWN